MISLRASTFNRYRSLDFILLFFIGIWRVKQYAMQWNIVWCSIMEPHVLSSSFLYIINKCQLKIIKKGEGDIIFSHAIIAA